MLSVDEARKLMPSKRQDTILKEVEELIVEAASKDLNTCKLPEGFFGRNSEADIIYNAKQNPLYLMVKEELLKGGYKIGRKDLTFYVSWA